MWQATVEDDWAERPPLPGDRDCDVVVVGAGYTGLWTAYYLIREDPTLRVIVLEAETAGFGASGRNGGWCSALFPSSLAKLAKLPGSSPAAALAQAAAMRDTVDEVGRVAAAEGIAADFHKGGTVVVARTPAQVVRALADVDHHQAWGLGDHLRWLGTDEARSRLDAQGTLGATYTPDCARIHPARLVRGLARVVEGAGVHIFEKTRVTALGDREVRTDRGVVRASVVVRATEGYTPALPGHARTVIPVYSLVTATAPLDDETWSRIGLSDRETFSDHRHLVIYGQRTEDGRLVFGGRGAPYHYGSRVRASYDRVDSVFDHLRRTVVDLFPVLADARFEHAWGGPLGIARDWCASVGLDRTTGHAWAGGYVGDGVATSNLAGRTLRDLILDRRTDLTRLPWVNHLSRRWEPEPLRWTLTNLGLRTMTAADTEERLTRRPSVLARAVSPFIGGH